MMSKYSTRTLLRLKQTLWGTHVNNDSSILGCTLRGLVSYPVLVCTLALTAICTVAIVDARSHARKHSPPESMHSLAELFAKEWVLQTCETPETNGNKDSEEGWFSSLGEGFLFGPQTFSIGCIWDFSREGMEAYSADSSGQKQDGLFSSTSYQHSYNSESVFTIYSKDGRGVRHDFLIKALTADSLILLEQGDESKGRTLSFASRARTYPSSGPPFWILVMIQAGAAISAHFLARCRTTSWRRFGTFCPIFLLVTYVGTKGSVWIFPARAMFGPSPLELAMVVAVLLGIAGGVLHVFFWAKSPKTQTEKPALQ